MAIKLTFTNLFQFFSALAPFLLTFFLIMMSIFNNNLKGIIYFLGIILASIINILLMNLFKHPYPDNAPPNCNLFDIPILNNYNYPAINSVIIAFTLSYLLLPMIQYNNTNYMIIGSIMGIFVIDAISKISIGCQDIISVILGGIIGGGLGMLWYTLFKVTGNKSLLFFEELIGNTMTCKKPAKQNFKCSVYKNGKVIKNL